MPTPLAEGPEEIVRGLLYKGEIFVFAGSPSAGKTRNQLHMFNGLATGQAGWWGQYDPMRVLYCSQRSWKVNSAQLRSVGVTELPDNFKMLCVSDLNRQDRSSFNVHPMEFVRKLYCFNGSKPNVIALDTLYNFLPSASSRNYSDYNTMYNACTELYHWAQQEDIGTSILHHASKQRENQKYEDPMERILGSTAILAITTSACVIEKVDPSDPQYVRLHFMSHLEPLVSPMYLNADRFTITSFDEIAMANTNIVEVKAGMKPLGEAEKKVLGEVPFQATDYTDILIICDEKFEMSKSQVYAILDKLAKKGYVINANNGVTGQKQVLRTRLS